MKSDKKGRGKPSTHRSRHREECRMKAKNKQSQRIKDDDCRNEIKLIFSPSTRSSENNKMPVSDRRARGNYKENHFDGIVEEEISVTAESYCVYSALKMYFNKTRGLEKYIQEKDGNVLKGERR